jgi:hypothetical protein
VKIWDIAAGQQLQTLRTQDASILLVGSQRFCSVAFSPDGTRLAVGTGGRQVLVWDARPLTDELRAELNAVNLVASLFPEHPLNEDVIEALEADSTISESVRNKALDRARKRQMNHVLLNDQSWSVVRQPGLRPEKYQLALRFAEAACKLAPDSGVHLGTLGMAQYRVGKYAEAVETLSRSDELFLKCFGTSEPRDVAFQAMAHFKLGHADRANKLLEQFRLLMQTDLWKTNLVCQRIMEEALQVINRPPVRAKRPASEAAGVPKQSRSK